MRRLSVIAIGFFLMSAGQLCAQTTDPFGSGGDPFAKQDDPFGPIDGKSRRVVPADSQPTLTPEPNKTAKQAASQPAALYPHVRVGLFIPMFALAGPPHRMSESKAHLIAKRRSTTSINR